MKVQEWAWKGRAASENFGSVCSSNYENNKLLKDECGRETDVSRKEKW